MRFGVSGRRGNLFRFLARSVHSGRFDAVSAVLAWALDERKNEPIRLLGTHPGAAAGTAALLDALYRSPVETRSNLWATVLTGVAPLLSETAQRVFCPPPGTGFTPEEFLDAGGTLYLI